jgi:hypothetical protein
MSKNILIVYYSQSGQLKNIVDNFTLPFIENVVNVEFFEIKPINDFPFPWTGKQFFDAMPESVMGIPVEIQEPVFKSEDYDLIIFAYQPWYLSPSIPAISMLKNEKFKKILKNTPVITLIGSRNMWVMAQDEIKILLKLAGAKLVGNIVLRDRHQNLVSAITVQYWMFTGKRDKWLGFFPKPGITENDICSAKSIGSLVLESFLKNDFEELQNSLVKTKAVEIHSDLLFIESRGHMMFEIWAKAILKKKNRALWINFFKYYLIIVLFVLSPFLLLIYILFFKPFLLNRIKKQKEFYFSVKY